MTGLRPALHGTEVSACHHVARCEFGLVVHVGHEPVPMLVEQYRAFSSDGFGDEEVFANGHGRGVELIELKIGDLRSGTQCGGQSIAGATAGLVVYG